MLETLRPRFAPPLASLCHPHAWQVYYFVGDHPSTTLRTCLGSTTVVVDRTATKWATSFMTHHLRSLRRCRHQHIASHCDQSPISCNAPLFGHCAVSAARITRNCTIMASSKYGTHFRLVLLAQGLSRVAHTQSQIVAHPGRHIVRVLCVPFDLIVQSARMFAVCYFRKSSCERYSHKSKTRPQGVRLRLDSTIGTCLK